jgi:hypothetical protein
VKELFNSLNMPFHALELDKMEEGPLIQDLLAGNLSWLIFLLLATQSKKISREPVFYTG